MLLIEIFNMYYQLNNIRSWTLFLLIYIIIFHPSQQTVSNGQFSTTDIKMKRFSNTISISIHKELPDLIPYQVFLQILFRLPEANVKNLAAIKVPSSNKNEGASYIIHGLRMNSHFGDPILHSNMLHEMGILTNETNTDENVQDFIERYIPDFAIRYYTCESFIFTLINDAFQSSENLDYLVKSRMIVTDLYNFLGFKLGGGIFLDANIADTVFYKAEVMSQDKVHLLKQSIGKYITFQSFLSTTTNKNRALDFINQTNVDRKKQAIVLYVIEMNDENDIQQLVQPFSNITFISCTPDELEIMFSIGQVFEIRSMIPDETNGIWTVYLQVLRMNETEHLNNITNYYLSKIVGKEIFYNGIQARLMNFKPLTITTFVTIGDYYSSILLKDYDKAEFYYQKFLEDELESPDDFDFQEQPIFYYNEVHNIYYLALGHINLQLARIRYEQQNYLESGEYIKKTQDAYMKLPRDLSPQVHMAQLENHMAKINWKHTEQYEYAAQHLLHALQLDRNNVEIFINIGLIQLSAGKYWYALNSFSTALSMIETLNETDYLSYGLIYRGKGQIYEKSNQTMRAISEYWDAQQIYSKSVPSNHELRQHINDDLQRVVKTKKNFHDDL